MESTGSAPINRGELIADFNAVTDVSHASLLRGDLETAETTDHSSASGAESDADRVKRIIGDYLEQLPMWQALEPSIVKIVDGIAREFDRPAHVEHRVKPVESLERKLVRRSTEVTKLQEITDLLGIRVVTLHLDSIASIVSRVEAAFHVDRRKSGLRTNLAGYRTRHVVCAVPTESRPQWFEIQIRTVGEHAWSELQHPVYKGAAADDNTHETLARIATLYHEAESLAAALRRRLRSGNGH